MNPDITKLIYIWSPISTFFDDFFSDNAGFLAYQVDISFVTKILPYSQICRTNVQLR